MRIALVSPYSWTYPGGVNRPTPSARRASDRRGNDVRVLCALGPAGPPQPYAPPRSLSAGPADAGLPDDARSHGRLRGQRRHLEPVGVPRCDREAAARAARRSLRGRPRAGAAGADARLGRDAGSRARPSSGPSTPTRRSSCPADRDLSRCAAQVQQAQRPHRRLRGRELDRQALVRRQLRDRPERGRHRRAAPTAEAGATTGSGCCSSAAPRSARACRCCCRAFEALVEHVPARLIVAGAAPRRGRSATSPTPRRSRHHALGGVTEDEKWGAPDADCSARRRSPARASGWS